MSSLQPLLDRQHGVIARRQVLDHLTARVLERRITSARWQVACRGVYVTHSGPLDRHQRRWVAVLGTGGVLAGLSALRSASGPVHVLIAATRRCSAPPEGVVVHRSSCLPDIDIRHLGDPPGTKPARSLVDAAQWAPTDQNARAIVAAGYQQRLVRPDEVRLVLARMRRAHRRALIAEMTDYAVSGAGSPAEADFLAICRRERFPSPSLQHPRLDARGWQRYLDAYFSRYGVHVEIDGSQHMEVRQWWADMRRQNELWIPGDRLLRFPAWVVSAQPADVAAQVRAALIAGGWQPDLR